MSDHNLSSITPEEVKDLNSYKRITFEAQERIEGMPLFEGFNKTLAAIQDGNKIGRDHYYFREILNGKKRTFHFCVDYDGYIKQLDYQEENVQ